jgi:hypothetical protein
MPRPCEPRSRKLHSNTAVPFPEIFEKETAWEWFWCFVRHHVNEVTMTKAHPQKHIWEWLPAARSTSSWHGYLTIATANFFIESSRVEGSFQRLIS